MKSPKEEIESIYQNLYEAFGLGSYGWDSIHLHFSRYMFCLDNRLAIVSEYLTWEWFVEQAKKYNIAYYQGIDTFLEEYKTAVKSRVHLED